MKVRRSRLATAALLVVVAGGLFLWQRTQDPGTVQQPAARIPLGECQGTLDDKRFSEILHSTSTATVQTTVTPPTESAPAYLSCTVIGNDQQRLVVTAVGAATEAERIHNEGRQVAKDFLPFSDGEAGERSSVVRFPCVVRTTPDGPDRTWYYTAVLELRTPAGSSNPPPGRQKMADLSVAFARQAIDKAPLGCTNTIQLSNGPVVFS
ncbi:hypothetical protein ACGF0D_43580 [Kitasatospora sp. NPDC048298]|uniref:hypothetical protein n=1 Tax=Kitasatospora sp. NPDC048298 TaxID=3364049 RepID=UPI003716F78B